MDPISHIPVESQKIYLIGGEESDSQSPTGSRTVNRVTSYDCDLQVWGSAPSMVLARRWTASIIHNNKIFVIGGIGGRGGTYEKRLNSVECLDLSERHPKWQLCAPMGTARSSHTVETLNGLIYVVGGGDGREWLNSAEVYDPKKNRWSSIASLKIKRWKCGLVASGGFIYAVGGMDSPKAGSWGCPLDSVERYSPVDNKWVEVTPMNDSRFGCAAISHQGKIYVSGGFGNDKNILNSSEMFDPETGKWTRLSPMKGMCGFVGGVLVDRPVHLEEGNI